MSERPGYNPEHELSQAEAEQPVEKSVPEKRFVTPEELAEYRKARIKEGGLYQIARGMLAFPRYRPMNESEHEQLVNLQDPELLTPYVRGYQETVATGKMGQIGQVTDLHKVPDPVLPRKTLTIATITYPDGTVINVPSLELGRASKASLEEQGLSETYGQYFSLEKDNQELSLGSRVLVDGLFIGKLRAIWPQGEGQPPLVGIEATEQIYVPHPDKPGAYAPKMGGEKMVYMRLSADRIGPAPEPGTFPPNIWILEE